MPWRYPRSNVNDGWDTYRRYAQDDRDANSRAVRGEGRRGDDMVMVRRSRTVQDDYYKAQGRRQSSRDTDQQKRYGAVRAYHTRDAQGDDDDDDAGEYYYARRSRRRDSAPNYEYANERDLRSRSPPVDARYRYQPTRSYDAGEDENRRPQRSRSERAPSSRREGDQSKRQQRDQNEQQQASNTQQSQGRGGPDDFMARHFDKGVDGWISAAAGAALGAITARHFAGGNEFKKQEQQPQNRIRRNWKTIAGAAVGALAANAAESHFTDYFEDENQEHAATGIEGAGEAIGAFAPDIL